MRNISMLQGVIPDEKIKRILTFAQNYKRYARIYFQVQSLTHNEIIVKVWQEENQTGKYCDAKELIEKTNEMLLGEVPDNYFLRVRPIVFNEMDHINADWLKDRMQEHGLQTKDLVKLINIDKSTLSEIVNGNKAFTKWHKSTFFYLFKYLEKTK